VTLGERRKLMATNLAIDERLLEEALKVGKHKSKKDTVNEALKEYVMRRKRRDILSLFGRVEMDPSYDYRKERNAR
jgi:Arc/MetJ family transcription regulator